MSRRLVLVAPYPELAELARQVCHETGMSIHVVEGDLQEGVNAARKISSGAEVFISRGGTAGLIAEQLDVPVVEINVSGFDLVRTLALAKKIGQKIGVIGFKNVIYGSKTLEKVLDIHIEELEIQTAEEVPIVVARAQKSGINVIVGDAVSVRCSLEQGLHALLVTSGKEAINQALREAQELAVVRRKERAKAKQFKAIIDFTYEGIIATDQEGRISLVNPAAEKILNISRSNLLHKPANEALPGLALDQIQENGKPRLGGLHRVGNAIVVQNVVPVMADEEIVGVVSTFQEAEYLQEVETKVRQNLYLKGHVAMYSFTEMVTQSQNMAKLIEQAKKFAMVEGTILITGETGSGKEILAQSIHNISQHKEGPFVAVNCAAVPENLLESELFGYEEGAFTGARKGGKKGYFELAHRGTLFLDEIGELPLNLQCRLLRVLQQKAVMRVGGDSVIPVDVRIIAATHRHLEDAVEQGSFRQDLYFRLNVLRLSLPPLRNRIEDIPLLTKMLLANAAQRTGCALPELDQRAISQLQEHSWPGNVRELENMLERLVVLKEGATASARDVIDLLEQSGVLTNSREDIAVSLSGSLRDIENRVIKLTLELTGFDKDETCQRLGISKTTLWRRLRDYN